MDQELTNMKMSKKEAENNAPTVAGTTDKGPQFPWGLQITLDNESLSKMGTRLADYKVGDVVELYAQCKVTRLSQSQNQMEGNRSEKNRTMELQITDMCLEATDKEAAEKAEDDDLGWDEDNPEKTDKKLKQRGF